MTLEEIIAARRLVPHPFEGYWRETAHVGGSHRMGEQLLCATDEAGWHSYEAEITYRLEVGGPVAITLSHDGVSAYGQRLLTPGDTLQVASGVLRTVSCLGRHAILVITFAPDAALTDRQFMPDNWYPSPEGRPSP